jgi:cytochrome d ubiquinol oxidase subunit I
MVALGSLLSASWIMAANSWMQTPDGVVWDGTRFMVTDWLKVINNPSWPIRLPHMLLAAGLTGSFLVSGIGALYLLKGRHLPFARRTVSLGLSLATVLIAGQVFIGDLLYGKMLKYQPAKMQAVEGFWDKKSRSPAPYLWFIVPDQKGQRNIVEIGTPILGSIWLTHSLTGQVEGLKNTPVDQQPRMGVVFYGFRLMYCIAIVMFTLVVISLWLRVRRTLFTTRWFLRALVVTTPAGVLATLGGWYTAEVGRQPFVIYGYLRSVDAISPVSASMLLTTLCVFVGVYAVFMACFITFFVWAVRRGPALAPVQPDASGSLKRAFRPNIAAQASLAAGGES